MLKEGYNPFVSNPLENIDFNKIGYFDTETTGLKPSIAQIVEIAAVRGSEQFYEKIELTEETKQLITQQAQSFERKRPGDKRSQESGYSGNRIGRYQCRSHLSGVSDSGQR